MCLDACISLRVHEIMYTYSSSLQRHHMCYPFNHSYSLITKHYVFSVQIYRQRIPYLSSPSNPSRNPCVYTQKIQRDRDTPPPSSLQVCRDFVRGRCTRDSSDCRYAHTHPSTTDHNLVTVQPYPSYPSVYYVLYYILMHESTNLPHFVHA